MTITVRHYFGGKRVDSNNQHHEYHRSLYDSLQTLFLPEGYPNSVTPDYLAFQCYDTLQAVCSYLRGILCTQAILVGVGVGDAAATAASATVQWFMRDFLAMVGGLLFAWLRASAFERDLKFWRLFADLINDIGLTLELVSPIYPPMFLALACAGNVCRSMCGVAAGSTRVALSHHFAKANNLGDISAKEGMQETFVTLVGLSLGMWCSRLLGDESRHATWAVFAVLTAVHVWANYRAMRVLVLRSINPQRLRIVWRVFGETRRVLDPVDVSRLERVFWYGDGDGGKSLVLGAAMPADYKRCGVHVYDAYAIWTPTSGGGGGGGNDDGARMVYVAVANGAGPRDLVRAYTHALHCTSRSVADAQQYVDKWFDHIWQRMGAQEWELHHIALGFSELRYEIVDKSQ